MEAGASEQRAVPVALTSAFKKALRCSFSPFPLVSRPPTPSLLTISLQPKMYNVLGLIFLALAIPGAWLQRDPEMGGLESSSLLSLADGKSNEEREKEEKKEGKTTKEMFADPLAWLLMISLFCTAVGGMYMSATYKAFAGDQGINGDFYFASLGSVGSLFNGFCR